MSEHQKFIVVFKDHVDQDKIDKYADEVKDNGGEVTAKYAILKGFAAHIPESMFQNLQGDDDIKYIEPDGVVTTQQQ